MATEQRNSSLNRRDFIRLVMMAGGMAAISPLLKACGGAAATEAIATATGIPTAIPTPDLTAGLEGLDIDAFIEESYRRLLLRAPEKITFLGLADEYGVGNDQLTDLSDGYTRQTQALEAKILEMLGRYNQATFKPEQALNAKIYAWSMDDMVRRHPFMYHNYPVTPFFFTGVPADLFYLLTETQPLADLQDAQDAISRLSRVKAQFTQLLDVLQRHQAAGIVIPRLLVPDTIAYLSDMVAVNAASTAFYRIFATKVSAISDLDSASKQELRDQAEAAIHDSVIPGFRLIIDYFKSLGDTAPQDVGLWQFPNGSGYYTYLLRHHITTDVNADELHEVGLRGVERIHAEMRLEFDRLGYPADESIPTLFLRARDESGIISGVEVMTSIQAILDKTNAMLDQVFDVRPQDELQVVRWDEGYCAFSAAPRNSNQPSFFHVTSGAQSKTSLPTTVFHEAVPGHYFQFAVARQFKLPPFREQTEFDSYLEGWALYAEHLMWELGAYGDDPYGNLGRLQSELLRAVRVVTETGIHAKRWTYERAVEYMEHNLGTGYEAKRYIGYPAQAVAYYIGYLKVLELRQRAMDTLGERFDLKGFHHVLLCNGELPLAILEQLVDEWVASKA